MGPRAQAVLTALLGEWVLALPVPLPSCTPFPLCLDPLLYQGHQEPGTEYQEVLYSQKPIRICGKKEAALLTYPGQRAAFAELLEAIAVALWGSLRV